MAKEALDPMTKKIILRDMLERQDEMEQVRAHNLMIINEPHERTLISDRRLVKNQQKVEMAISFFTKMNDQDQEGPQMETRRA
jgi:hypothetical protein